MNEDPKNTADGWRGDAIVRINAAFESVSHADAQFNLLRGIADLLLAIDTRLADQSPPFHVLLSPDEDVDPATIEWLRDLVKRSPRRLA